MKTAFLIFSLLASLTTLAAPQVECFGYDQETAKGFVIKVSRSQTIGTQKIQLYSHDEETAEITLYASGTIKGELLPGELCEASLKTDSGKTLQAKVQRGRNAFESVIGLQGQELDILFTGCMPL